MNVTNNDPYTKVFHPFREEEEKMKREIKYRAWDTVAEQMLPVEIINFRQDLITLDEGDNSVSDTAEMFILMQYTGVHDDSEDQEELYDGDIAEVEHEDQKHICKVQYCGSGYMFVADSLPDGYLWLTEFIEFDREYCWAEGTKKLGNIYDNPNLLEG